MIEISKMGAQGDCLFRRVAKMPKEAQRSDEKGPLVVAHSETGHHHSIDERDGVAMFTVPGDPLRCYLQLDGVEYADVVHHRAWDTHDTIRLLGGGKKATVYEVRRQREYVPEGWRRVED